jgi:hypothetical protein
MWMISVSSKHRGFDWFLRDCPPRGRIGERGGSGREARGVGGVRGGRREGGVVLEAFRGG